MQVKRPYSKLPPQNYLSKITSPKSPYNNNKIPNIINLWNSAQRNNHRATIKDEDEDEERGEAILLLLLLWNPTWPVSIAPQDVGRRSSKRHWTWEYRLCCRSSLNFNPATDSWPNRWRSITWGRFPVKRIVSRRFICIYICMDVYIRTMKRARIIIYTSWHCYAMVMAGVTLQMDCRAIV